MDPNAIANLALLALQSTLAIIAEIKKSGGLTDDQLMAQAQQIAGDNDTLYQSLKTLLTTLK